MDGTTAQKEGLRDFGIGHAASHQAQDFDLPGSEVIQAEGLGLRGSGICACWYGDLSAIALHFCPPDVALSDGHRQP